MTEQQLGRKIASENWFQIVLGVCLTLGAIFAWVVTYGVALWLGWMFQEAVEFLFPRFVLLEWIPAILTAIILLAVALAGFTREHDPFDLGGWADSSANLGRVGGGDSPLTLNASNRYSGEAYVLVEILLLAPLFTREAIGRFRARIRTKPQQVAQASEILREIEASPDWIPRGRYHGQLDAVELLLRLGLIRQSRIQGVASLRPALK